MALAPLATVADLAARGVTVAPDETATINTALEVASAAVRDAAGSPISSVTSTVALEGGADLRLPLPGRPVTAVSAVLVNGTAVTDYKLSSGALWRARGWADGCSPAEVTVTYTHGLPVVPADIVDLVCRLAGGVLVELRSGDALGALASRPLVSERIGDYSAVYSYAAPLLSSLEIPDYLRKRLAARFGGSLLVVKSR